MLHFLGCRLDTIGRYDFSCNLSQLFSAEADLMEGMLICADIDVHTHNLGAFSHSYSYYRRLSTFSIATTRLWTLSSPCLPI